MPGSRSTRTEILGALSAGLLVVAVCLILLWHNPQVFWNDDYELSVLPVFADMMIGTCAIDSIRGAARAPLRQYFSRLVDARSRDSDDTESVCLSR